MVHVRTWRGRSARAFLFAAEALVGAPGCSGLLLSCIVHTSGEDRQQAGIGQFVVVRNWEGWAD